MKRAMPWLGLAAVLASAALLAQVQYQPTPAAGQNVQTANRNVVGTQLMSGTVWSYKPGQSIVMKAGDGKEYELPLESGVRVDGSVREGQLAALMWTTDAAGKPRVMSITAAPANASDIERSAPSHPGRPPAAAVPNVTPSLGSTTPGATATAGAARRTPRSGRATTPSGGEPRQGSAPARTPEPPPYPTPPSP